nr:glutathione s-transferase omega-like 2 [Quercus suber]
MLRHLTRFNRTIVRDNSQIVSLHTMSASFAKSWHDGPNDAFHGRITQDGPFLPEKNRYHLYIGLFCPFAHRANVIFQMKELAQHAGIRTSVVRPYPKGNDQGWPGWQFNVAGEPAYEGIHGRITQDGPFLPEKNRYHLYIGLFCPFAHRANVIFQMKELAQHAGIRTSVVRPYPKGNDQGWPGWQFNVAGEPAYEGATEDPLFGSKYLHELYFKADKHYKGKYSVPVFWDTQTGTIVNNESLELLRDLQTAFDPLLPAPLAALTLYPAAQRSTIDRIGAWLQTDLNTRVYKTGFAPDQATYAANVPVVFAALNALEKIAHAHRGPYLLGPVLTELDVRAYATLIRFDPVYVQHFKCNLAMLRGAYPVLQNWLVGMYHNLHDHDVSAFGTTTDFRHIKENYTKSHPDINPRAITPLGPWPDIAGPETYEPDWTKLSPGSVDMPEVLEHERTLH